MKHPHFLAISAIMALSLTLTGCLPTSHSLGASLMAMPLDHRVSGNDTEAHLAVSADGFWDHTSSASNLQSLNAGGANVSVTYHLGGDYSPLFVNAAFGGSAGSTKFDCNSHEDCNDGEFGSKYIDWLKTREGKKSYSFWDLQERVLAGMDFNPGNFLIIGFGLGAQIFQGYSDYDNMRKKLGSNRTIENLDDKLDGGLTSAFWIGSHLGNNGEYGNIVSEYNILHKGHLDEWVSNIKFTYTHPSGFFGGFAGGSIIELTLFAGKTFIF